MASVASLPRPCIIIMNTIVRQHATIVSFLYELIPNPEPGYNYHSTTVCSSSSSLDTVRKSVHRRLSLLQAAKTAHKVTRARAEGRAKASPSRRVTYHMDG